VNAWHAPGPANFSLTALLPNAGGLRGAPRGTPARWGRLGVHRRGAVAVVDTSQTPAPLLLHSSFAAGTGTPVPQGRHRGGSGTPGASSQGLGSGAGGETRERGPVCGGAPLPVGAPGGGLTLGGRRL